MTRNIDVTKFSCIIAGAQKNLGPAGVTMMIVHENLLGKEQKICPAIWSLKKQADMDSRLNTPPCYRYTYLSLINITVNSTHE